MTYRFRCPVCNVINYAPLKLARCLNCSCELGEVEYEECEEVEDDQL